MSVVVDEPTAAPRHTYPLTYTTPAIVGGRWDGSTTRTRTVTVSAPVGVEPDSRGGWTPSLRARPSGVGTEVELARRVRRLRRSLARLGYRLHRRGEGYMVADAETRSVLAGASPSAYGLSLDDAEGCLELARAQG